MAATGSYPQTRSNAYPNTYAHAIVLDETAECTDWLDYRDDVESPWSRRRLGAIVLGDGTGNGLEWGSVNNEFEDGAFYIAVRETDVGVPHVINAEDLTIGELAVILDALAEVSGAAVTQGTNPNRRVSEVMPRTFASILHPVWQTLLEPAESGQIPGDEPCEGDQHECVEFLDHREDPAELKERVGVIRVTDGNSLGVNFRTYEQQDPFAVILTVFNIGPGGAQVFNLTTGNNGNPHTLETLAAALETADTIAEAQVTLQYHPSFGQTQADQIIEITSFLNPQEQQLLAPIDGEGQIPGYLKCPPEAECVVENNALGEISLRNKSGSTVTSVDVTCTHFRTSAGEGGTTVSLEGKTLQQLAEEISALFNGTVFEAIPTDASQRFDLAKLAPWPGKALGAFETVQLPGEQECEGFVPIPICRPNRATGSRVRFAVQEEIECWGRFDCDQQALGLELVSDSLTNPYTVLDDPSLRGRRTRFKSQQGRFRPAGDLVGQLQPHGVWPLLLKHALGEITDTQGDGPYTHTIRGAETLPTGLTVEKRINFPNGRVSRLQYLGSRVNELFLGIPAQGPVIARAGLIARQEEIDPKIGMSETAVYPLNNEPFSTVHGTILMDQDGSGDRTVIATITALNLLLSNAMDPDQFIFDDTPHRSAITENERVITGNLSAMFTWDNLLLYERYLANASFSMEFALVRGSYEWRFVLPSIALRGEPTPVMRRGPLSLDLQFEAHRPPGGGPDVPDVEVTIVNDDPVIATASG